MHLKSTWGRQAALLGVLLFAGSLYAQTRRLSSSGKGTQFGFDTKRMTLIAAESAGLVQTKYASLGGSSGGVITVTVTRTAKAAYRFLALAITPGTRLRNLSGQQDMVIARLLGHWIDGKKYEPQSEIMLIDDKPKKYVLDAYCLEAHKPNPEPTSQFQAVDEDSDPVIACVARKSRSQGLSMSAKQAAFWIVTDHLSFQQVAEKIAVTAKDWNAAVALVNTCVSSQ